MIDFINKTLGKLLMYKFCGIKAVWYFKTKLYLRDKYYNDNCSKPTNIKRLLIVMCDGKVRHGGLGDRIHGILSVYKFCKEKDLDFRIHFVHPFDLQEYFVPNKYSWIIGKNEISFNAKESNPLWFYCTFNKYGLTLDDDNILHYKHLSDIIKQKNYKQYHIYSNAHFCIGSSYSELFNELFKPSVKLQHSIDINLSNIGNDFIAMVFRFQQLLGDFKERNFPTLTKEEGDRLIRKNIEKVREIYYKCHRSMPLLVTSDSKKFLDEVNKLDFVYVIPGRVVHLTYTPDNDYELHLKSFLDLMLLSKAKKIYLLCTEGMYHSGFAQSAALINNTDYEEVFF
ncbi:MAG: hypothetical protein LBE13_01050 [Bacteroidales bacterium]|jgi:hypothetical protein|nr:hypothetical protein [Bacteroidales bacterium]